MRATLSVLLVLTLSGCPGPADKDAVVPHDRSTPSATFGVFQQGIERNQFREVVECCSLQQKRLTLFEMLFMGGMASGQKKKAFEQVLLAEGVQLNRIESSASDVHEFFASVEREVGNLDRFLTKSQEAFFTDDHKSRVLSNIEDVQIDGDRATVAYNRNNYSYHTPAGETVAIEKVSTSRKTMRMRKFGDEWLICPEGEWKDISFKWTVGE